MNKIRVQIALSICSLVGGVMTSLASAAVSGNLLNGTDFSVPLGAKNIPAGWTVYGAHDTTQGFQIAEGPEKKKVLRFDDSDDTKELGITQVVPGTPGLTYQASVDIQPIKRSSTEGAFLQLRFLPSNKFEQVSIEPEIGNDGWSTISVRATAPADTTSVQVYIYSHTTSKPQFFIRSASLVSGAEVLPGLPEPIPPQYSKLKNLYLNTNLVAAKKANAVIVAPAGKQYQSATTALQKALLQITGVSFKVVADNSPQAAVPLTGNVILLGNRSTNAAVSKLYDAYYTLTDLKYPGAAGYEVRTLHNPYGNGFNAILLGGSDDAGVMAATNKFIEKLKGAEHKNDAVSIGRLMEIKIGDGIDVPKELNAMQIWEASNGYGSTGYFGWNMISKNLAMYYMTGEKKYAREAIRLSFPDDKAKEEISKVDGELIENKDDPLAGPYHYNATMMILYWDLVEESPVFTDEERLKVTNAFSRQLLHRKEEGVYPLTRPALTIGSRHGLYGALSLYPLGRYFAKDYGDPVWQQCVKAVKNYFAPLRQEHPWIYGENDNLFWYSTGAAPVLTYMVMSGEREAVTNGALANLLRNQELLFNGRSNDANLRYASIDYLNKAAYLTGDGRWLTYLNRTGIDTNAFRLGQSFWPDAKLKASQPNDLLNRWMIGTMPPAQAASRSTSFPADQSFMNASYRSAIDGSGDYLLLDGMNGEGRNPYHSFALLELRLNGQTWLQGYNNQVQTKADGMVEPLVAMDGALRKADTVGPSVFAAGQVPNAAFTDWKRNIVERDGRYAVIVDDLGFRTDSDHFEAQFLWQKNGARWMPSADGSQLTLSGNVEPDWSVPAPTIRALNAKYKYKPTIGPMIAELPELNIVVLRATEPGATLEMPFEVKNDWSGKLWARFLNYNDRGNARIFLDDKPVGKEYKGYAAGATPTEVDLGDHTLTAGTHRLRLEVTGKSVESRNYFIGFMGVALSSPNDKPATALSGPQIVSSDQFHVTNKGDYIEQTWEGVVKKDTHRSFFSVLGEGNNTPASPLSAVRLADNAAALKLPQPALAVNGAYGQSKGETVILASDHLFGWRLEKAGAGSELLSSSKPAFIDWDFTTGKIEIHNEDATALELQIDPTSKLIVDGKGTPVDKSGKATLALSAGKHTLTGARPSAASIAQLTNELKTLATTNIPSSDNKQSAVTSTDSNAAAVPVRFEAPVDGDVADCIIVDAPGGRLFYTASGQKIQAFDANGKSVQTMETDGAIRLLHWWPEHNLLLAGCVDEKVIAFDANGQRKWTFVSEMAPEVFQAAKQYWFKTAPGHNGIHGLDSGVFLDGKSQAFVGSACTLEIIDENGKIIKRLPQFWGTVGLFNIIPGPDNSLNLLAARRITEYPNLAVINNKTLDPTQRNFVAVPPGYTTVGGWTDQTRFHIFHQDVDGDGAKEIISEITGAWNRVTVWDEQGQPKYNVHFGPGDNVYAGGMNTVIAPPIRGIDVADVTGDSKPEIVVALSGGLIVAMDGQCRKIWSHKLTVPPTTLKIVGRKIVIGTVSGAITTLDGEGNVVSQNKVAAWVTSLTPFDDKTLLAAYKGGVTALALP